MREEVDMVASLFIGSDETTPHEEEECDAFARLFEQGALAASIGGWTCLEKLTRETSNIDARADAILKAERRAPNSPAPARSEWDAPLIDDSHRLEKRYAGIHRGEKAARVEKSANGKWTLEYDESNELIRGYSNEAA
jgi:hypothetical protein